MKRFVVEYHYTYILFHKNLLLEGVCEKDPDNCQNLRLRGKDSRHVAYVTSFLHGQLQLFRLISTPLFI